VSVLQGKPILQIGQNLLLFKVVATSYPEFLHFCIFPNFSDAIVFPLMKNFIAGGGALRWKCRSNFADSDRKGRRLIN
jgi:hypothetical protein